MGWRKGAVVMEATPFAHVVMQKFREERCNFCLKSCGTMKKCAACQKTWYCGVQCQKGDWKLHKAECPIMKRVPDVPTDSMRLFLRLVIRVVSGASDLKFEKTESPCLRTFKDLMAHTEDVGKDNTRFELFEMARDFLKAYTHGLMSVPSDETLLEIFGKMVTNTFTIADEFLQDVGVAIYNSPSILDHNCIPNVVASFDGRKVIVRAIADVDSDSYNDLFLSYIDPLATIAERQDQLQGQYYFTCTCDRCSTIDVETTMTSTEGGSQGEVEVVKSCLERLAQMRAKQEEPKSILESCEKCLQDVHLPATNVYMVRLRSAAFDAAVDTQSWDKAVQLGVVNLKPYQSLHPPYTPGVGYLYATVGKILLFLGKLSEALAHLNKALENLHVSLGERHFLFHQVGELKQQCEEEMERERES